MSLKTIVIRWQGPHTLEDISASNIGNGLYFLSGRRKYERRDQIQYFGITKRLYRQRIKYDHQAIGQIRENTLRIWLGQIEYPKLLKSEYLRLAEACLIYFWQPNLNKIGKIRRSDPVCIVSKWTKPDGSIRKNRLEVYKDLPDVLWWEEDEYWRTGNLKLAED